MKTKIKKQIWRDLTAEELVETNGGSERKDEKRANLWEKIVQYFKM